jgi:hypothetical protein
MRFIWGSADQRWSGKSAVFLMESALMSHGSIIASIIFFKIFRMLFLWIILVIIDFWLQLRLVVGVLLVFIVRRVWRKRSKGQTTIYKTQHIKLKIEQHEHRFPVKSAQGQIVPSQIGPSQIEPKSKRLQNESQIGHIFQIE